MSVQTQFAGMLTESVSYQAVTGRNSDGEETLGAATAYTCRVERRNKRFVNDQGQVIASTVQVYLFTTDALTASAWVTVAGEARRVLGVEVYTDEQATPYKVIHA